MTQEEQTEQGLSVHCAGRVSDRRMGKLPAGWQREPAMLAIPCSDRDSMTD